MKKVLALLLLLYPLILFSQKWEYKYLGNSFDGYKRVAFVLNSESTLGIVNNSDSINIQNSIGGDTKNGRDKLNIKLVVKDDFSPTKILMAFDREQKYYIVNYSADGNVIYLHNAISTDYKQFLSDVRIIALLQSKETIHFRLLSGEEHSDYDFPLKGSGEAITKTFKCKSCKEYGNWSDAVFELINFIYLFSKVNQTQNYNSVSSACIDYFTDKYGQFYYTQVGSIETEGGDDFPDLVFKNTQGDILDKIKKESYLKNYYHFSGNPKKVNGKILKDLPTIEIYYDAFNNNTDLIKSKNISLEEFSQLNKTQLQVYYKTLKQNTTLLDYLRNDESIYYRYERNEYTFEVFLEAWGIEKAE